MTGEPMASVPAAAVAAALAGQGLQLDLGLARLRLRSNIVGFANDLRRVYPSFRFLPVGSGAELHVDIVKPRSLRRWWRPQVLFHCDGRVPFEPFPSSHALPLMEWGTNWLIGSRLNDYLLLHAGVVERDGVALLMPAMPGSGKSTLTAALSLRGWRLLSDEFGAVDPLSGFVYPVIKPVALKNTSINVIRDFGAQAVIGPSYEKTRKGTVAHLTVGAQAVARAHEPALPGAVVLPQWSAGGALHFQPVDEEIVFRALAFNAFNYAVLGAIGFHAVVDLVRHCRAWELSYTSLDEALGLLDAQWPAVVAAARARSRASFDKSNRAAPVP